MGSLGLAVGLSMLSAASYAAAAVAQERLAEHGHRGRARWATALVLTAAGVLLHVLALNFGTVAVVQALGTLTLLFALPISALRYHVRIGPVSWLDAGLTVAGLALILSLSVDSGRPALLSGPDGRYLSLATLVTVVVIGGGAWFAGARMRAVMLAAAAGVAFGIASVLSKAVMATVTDSGVDAISPFIVTMVVIFSVVGYLLGQLSYKGAGLAAPLATVSVVNPVAAAIAGVVVFDERFRFGHGGLAVVGIAAVVITWGVIGLSRRTAVAGTTTESEDRPADDAEPVEVHAEPKPDPEAEPTPH
ncbi:DMT family transporter [Actinoplanes sp. NPDC051411]|uniref:DMT family transporter n=1 Tax=Actinoplanes sp. NPDC051411 TaxID=3155522 RepID=UPI00344524EB